jgi:RNA polymerase sigma-70 factor (ECF subfamily)
LKKVKEPADVDDLVQDIFLKMSLKLNITVSGAKSRVQRGRQKVKEMVIQCCDVNADVYGNILDFTPRKPGCKKNC